MSEHDQLRAEFAVTEEDVYRLFVYGTLHDLSTMIRVSVYFLLLFGLTTHLIVTDFPGTQYGLAAAWGLLAGVAFLLIARWLLRLKARRSGQDMMGSIGERAVEISPEGFLSSSPKGEAKLNWSAFSRFVGTSDYLYFYMGKRAATVVPRRAFPSWAASQAFLEAAREWHVAEMSLTAT